MRYYDYVITSNSNDIEYGNNHTGEFYIVDEMGRNSEQNFSHIKGTVVQVVR